MWLMSKRPTRERTAWCSSMIERVLQGHEPAAEVDDAALVGSMPVGQRGGERGLSRHEERLRQANRRSTILAEAGSSGQPERDRSTAYSKVVWSLAGSSWR